MEFITYSLVYLYAYIYFPIKYLSTVLYFLYIYIYCNTYIPVKAGILYLSRNRNTNTSSNISAIDIFMDETCKYFGVTFEKPLTPDKNVDFVLCNHRCF